MEQPMEKLFFQILEVKRWRKGETNGIHPTFMFVDNDYSLYVSDYKNHRVMRWCPEANEGTIIVGGNGKGKQPNQLTGPTGLAFDLEGNLYVADSWNNRIYSSLEHSNSLFLAPYFMI
jgi:sugar lactone lactonase YvrE